MPDGGGGGGVGLADLAELEAGLVDAAEGLLGGLELAVEVGDVLALEGGEGGDDGLEAGDQLAAHGFRGRVEEVVDFALQGLLEGLAFGELAPVEALQGRALQLGQLPPAVAGVEKLLLEGHGEGGRLQPVTERLPAGAAPSVEPWFCSISAHESRSTVRRRMTSWTPVSCLRRLLSWSCSSM